MSILKQLKQDYKATWDAYKDARKKNDKKSMERLSHDLVKIADQMEYES